MTLSYDINKLKGSVNSGSPFTMLTEVANSVFCPIEPT